MAKINREPLADYGIAFTPPVKRKQRAPVDPIEQVLIALRRVIRATDMHSKHLSKTTGLTAPQILVLQAIRDKGQVTIGELAKDISLSQATVTTILDRLEKRELVYRERSETDKRKVHAFLTDQAFEILKDAPMPLQDHFTRQFRDLHNWEQTMILSALQRVAHMMDAQDIDASPFLDIGTLDRYGYANDGSGFYSESDSREALEQTADEPTSPPTPLGKEK